MIDIEADHLTDQVLHYCATILKRKISVLTSDVCIITLYVFDHISLFVCVFVCSKKNIRLHNYWSNVFAQRMYTAHSSTSYVS